MNEMNTGAEQEELDFDLGKLIRHYLKHWIAILTSGAVTALAALLITTFFITPQYQASAMLYVNSSLTQQGVTEVNAQNLATSQRLVNTYVNIINSNAVLQDVIRKGNLKYTAGQIRGMMTVRQVSNTEMFTVSIINEDPEMAAHIANTIAETAPQSVSFFVEGSSTKIVDRAVVPQAPFTPSYSKNIVLGGILGCLVTGFLLTLQYLFDMRLKDEDDINSYFSAPVLGSIPEIEDNAGKAGEDK